VTRGRLSESKQVKASFRLLATADVLLLCLTAAMGTTVVGTHHDARHVLLGVMAALFTCFVHVIAFVYFMVQDKIIKQSILLYGLDASYAAPVDRQKARVLKLAMIGIASMIVTTALGAAESDVHFWAALTSVVLNAVLFVRQDGVIREYGVLFRRAMGES
jgi:heme A synthase